MCPTSAIIFPKYADSPINGDDVTPSPQAQSESPRDLRSLLQGDVYDKIRRREPGRRRFSTEAPDPAPGGPCPTLDALRRDLDIPDDVLASLSGAELQRIRAEANKGRAQEKPRDEAGGKKESRNA
jgi:hypothetical protein